jgi:7-cyano-7-deazaguanine synthase
MQMDQNAALVLLSGGQDSATCLAWALDRYRRVETVGFDYGQRHAVELEARERVREWFADQPALGSDHRLDVPTFGQIGATAMTADIAIEWEAGGLPNTFVPGRNLAFLVFAGALAHRRGIANLVGGMCGTDAAGYPDCRPDAIEAQANALVLGLAPGLRVEVPLIRKSKSETWALAAELGGPDLVAMMIERTHTCYKGDRGRRHDWGYGCGECPACRERARGFAEWTASA